jgi:F-type H+-transporting ATPase subunit b
MIANILAFSSMYSGDEGGGGLLSVNEGLAFWVVLTFLILVFVLTKFAWKPIIAALNEREKNIKDSLELAEKSKEESKRLLEENKSNLHKAEEESRKIIGEARVFAESLKNQIMEESKVQSQKIIASASEEIERKKEEAFGELKNQVAEISLQIAEKVIKQNLNTKLNAEVIDKYINELQKN